jgi:hypothetical protein
MSRTFHLKIGDHTVALRQSDSLIAVKTSSEAGAVKLASLTVPSPTFQGRGLAGFELRQVRTNGTTPRDALAILRQSDTITQGTEVFHTSDDDVPFVPTGEIFLRFQAGASKAQIEELLDRERLVVIEGRPASTFIVATTSASDPVIEVAARLQEEPIVTVAEPELATLGRLAQIQAPSDVFLREQWHLKNVGFHRNTSVGFKEGADARVVEAWEQAGTLGDRNVVVAVIDDGFDLEHPDLAAPAKIVAPRDFTRNSAHPAADWRRRDWHGTACAGVAVGAASNGGIVGAAPGCRLMPVRWGELTPRQVAAWFDWVREHGAWVVSCSWGAAARYYPLGTEIKEAIERCAREGRGGKGIVICFAAANDDHDINDGAGFLHGFAVHPDVIAVAASTSRDQRAHYSNFGQEISVCAPSSGAGGYGVTTADVTGTFTVHGITYDKGYAPGPVTHDFGGTSSACPLVAGVCALVLSVNPGLTAAEVRDVIQRTARRIGDPNGYDDRNHSRYFGYGCVNAVEAVKLARSLL